MDINILYGLLIIKFKNFINFHSLGILETYYFSDTHDMSLISRHKKIYSALDRIIEKIHALSIHAFTYDEYQKNNRSLKSPNCQN